MLKAHKIRIYPNSTQRKLLDSSFGASRAWWNYLHACWRNKETKLTEAQWKRQEGYEWSLALDKDVFQATTRQYNQAWSNRKKNKKHFGMPQFKKKRVAKLSYTTYCTNNNIRTEEKKVEAPKLGWIRMSEELRFKGNVKQATFSKTKSGKYFASILVETENFQLKPVESQLGLDLGLTHFVTDSNKNKVEAPRYFRKTQEKLAKAQRRLSKRQKPSKGKKSSNRYEKQRIKVARLHEKIANQRADFLHQLSHKLTHENQVLVAESLAVKEMLQDKDLAKSISDASWSEFLRQLEYKSAWRGRTFVQIDQWFASSQICSACQHIDGKKELEIREWACSNCGAFHDRDINAARNILNEGLRILEVA